MIECWPFLLAHSPAQSPEPKLEGSGEPTNKVLPRGGILLFNRQKPGAEHIVICH